MTHHLWTTPNGVVNSLYSYRPREPMFYTTIFDRLNRVIIKNTTTHVTNNNVAQQQQQQQLTKNEARTTITSTTTIRRTQSGYHPEPYRLPNTSIVELHCCCWVTAHPGSRSQVSCGKRSPSRQYSAIAQLWNTRAIRVVSNEQVGKWNIILLEQLNWG